MNRPLTLPPAARAAVLRASALGQARLQGLLAVEAAIARNPEKYPELAALLRPAAATSDREVA